MSKEKSSEKKRLIIFLALTIGASGRVHIDSGLGLITEHSSVISHAAMLVRREQPAERA
jgi:hypothetical protein